jgi:DNA-binding NtrC family response regulator
MLRPSSAIVGESAFSAELKQFVRSAARSSDPILLLGEAGTGKEMLARAIHFASTRRNSPFLMIDCSLFYERELERELFGYRPGPGEPAEAARTGLLEFTPRGSCYATNVEELSPSMQLRILNLLDTGYLQPVGGDRPASSRIRLIFSSEKNLRGFSEGGLFSEELFRRFAGLTRHLRPLRERAEDVAPLVRHFAGRLVEERGAETGGLEITGEAMEALRSYPWPGNIDELKAEVGRILGAGHRRIGPELLATSILHNWRGRQGDPAVVRVVQEIDAQIREFLVMSRLDAEYGDVLLDVEDWDVLFKASHRTGG